MRQVVGHKTWRGCLHFFVHNVVIVCYWRIVGMTGNGEVGSIPESQAVSASIFPFCCRVVVTDYSICMVSGFYV